MPWMCQCGASNDQSYKFCKQCGCELPACGACGQPIPLDVSNFCVYCGKPLAAEPQPPNDNASGTIGSFFDLFARGHSRTPGQTGYTPPKPESGAPWIRGIFAFFIVISVILVWVALSDMSKGDGGRNADQANVAAEPAARVPDRSPSTDPPPPVAAPSQESAAAPTVASGQKTEQATPPAPQQMIPPDESRFVLTCDEYRKQYAEAPNEFVKSSLRRDRAELLAKIIPGKSVENWVGKISSMTTTGGGYGALTIKMGEFPVTIGTWNNGLSDSGSGTLIPPDSPLYRTISTLKVGDAVTFSGRFLDSDRDYVKEKSITENGSMSEPEFVFVFTVITPGVVARSNSSGHINSSGTAVVIDAAERKRLEAERQYASEIVTAANAILAANSPGARAEIYCRFTINEAEAIATPDGVTGKALGERYSDMLQAASDAMPVF